MKIITSLIVAVLMLSISSLAQNTIQLNINHHLGTADFALETGAKNNLNNDFEITRLQYYIADITIVHDGGLETVFDHFWVLVNASEITQIDLEDSNIYSVEMVKLHIGVDQEHNHFNPTTFPVGHPLSPQIPSMHWDETEGFLFVALEGNGGDNYDQSIQLHGFGDDNYFTTEIAYTTQLDNNEIVINLDADYTRALEDVDVSSGVVVQGNYGAAKLCLENFRDFVFTPASETSTTVDFSEVSRFEVYPNPVINGDAVVLIETGKNLLYEISVTNILGQQIKYFENVNSNSTINLQLNESGLYFITLMKSGKSLMTKKLIIK